MPFAFLAYEYSSMHHLICTSHLASANISENGTRKLKPSAPSFFVCLCSLTIDTLSLILGRRVSQKSELNIGYDNY